MAEQKTLARRVRPRDPRHLRRRAADHEGATEDDQEGLLGRAAHARSRRTWRRRTGTSSVSSRSLASSARSRQGQEVRRHRRSARGRQGDHGGGLRRRRHGCLPDRRRQRVEHYEMAAYGTLIAWAQAMGHDEVVDLLQQNLDQEKAADEKLSSIAEGGVNQEAAELAHPDKDDRRGTAKRSGRAASPAFRPCAQLKPTAGAIADTRRRSGSLGLSCRSGRFGIPGIRVRRRALRRARRMPFRRRGAAPRARRSPTATARLRP